jgi:hypothetical protein
VFGIFTSRAMRERGKYQIQLMKTRSSSGVGQKIDLDFNIDTLRITDPGEDGQTDNSAPISKGSSILAGLQRKSTVDEDGVISDDPNLGASIPRPKAQVESSKLRSLISNLGQSDEL